MDWSDDRLERWRVRGASVLRGAGLDGAVPARLSVLAAPRGLSEHNRRPLFDPAFPALVTYSQKAGSTAVLRWYLARIGRLEEALSYSPWAHDYEHQVFVRRPGYMAQLRTALRAGAPILKAVREPLARAYSGYLALHNPAVFKAGQPHAMRRWRRDALRFATGARRPDLTARLPFSAYLRWVERCDGPTLNGHFARQLGWIDRAAGERITYWRVDRGLEDLNAFEARHGLRATTSAELDAARMPSHDIRKVEADGAALERLFEEGLDPEANIIAGAPALTAARLKGLAQPSALVRRVLGAEFTRFGYAPPAG